MAYWVKVELKPDDLRLLPKSNSKSCKALEGGADMGGSCVWLTLHSDVLH